MLKGTFAVFKKFIAVLITSGKFQIFFIFSYFYFLCFHSLFFLPFP